MKHISQALNEAFMKFPKHKPARSEAPSAQEVRELLEYDPHSGIFRRKVSAGRWAAGTTVGSLDQQGYIEVSVKGYRTRAHRLAWLYVTGEWPCLEIDHINGHRSDNRFSNLREVSRAANMQNLQGPKSGNKSGLLGVWRDKRDGRFYSQITVDGGRRVNVGVFDTAEEAYAAYIKAKRELHEGCTL